MINVRWMCDAGRRSLMDPEVLDGYRAAAANFVLIGELQERAGEVIARATGAEAGYVVSGVAAGLTLAAGGVHRRARPRRDGSTAGHRRTSRPRW